MHRGVRFLVLGAFSCLVISSRCAGVKEVRPGPTDSQAVKGPVTEGVTLTQPAQEAPAPEEYEYRLGVNDVVHIAVWGHADMTGDFQVKKEGKIYLPLVEGVPVENLTASEAKAKVGKALAMYIRRPQVELEVKEYSSRVVLVMGAVMKGGPIPLVRNTTLLDAVGLAGGIRGGSPSEIFLLRKGQVRVYDLLSIFERHDMSQNIALENRDVLYVPLAEDRKVYVLGWVERPGIVPLTSSRMGLVEAISMSGGFKNGAISDDVRVIRGGLANPTLFTVDVDRILKGRSLAGQGFTMASGDIIYVPQSALVTWNHVIDLIKPTMDMLFSLPVQTYSEYLIIKNFQGGGK